MTPNEAIAFLKAGAGDAIRFTPPFEKPEKVLVTEIKRLRKEVANLNEHCDYLEHAIERLEVQWDL